MTKSALQIARASYVPKIPTVFKGNIQIKEGAATASVDDQEEIKNFSHISTVCLSLLLLKLKAKPD